jgi:large subunit ribosomal protein L18
MNERQRKRVRCVRRVKRVRKRIFGTPERPRLAVSRSLRHLEAQVIDDTRARTLCSASTRSRGRQAPAGYGGNTAAAQALGKTLAEKARALGIEKICFDRRGRKYHGRLRAFAEAAREAGLSF